MASLTSSRSSPLGATVGAVLVISAASAVGGAAGARAAPAPTPVADAKPLLFASWDGSTSSHHPSLELEVGRPDKGPMVVTPTEPWEAFAISAYTSVVAVAPGEYRMYYDCIEGTGPTSGGFGGRRICLATSKDGLTWTKPSLGVFNLNGSTANNIVLDDSGVSVFLDLNPSAPSEEKWKMACSKATYASPDGITWHKLANYTPTTAQDDTKPTARWDPSIGKYVVYVRRDIKGTRPGDTRKIGRCVTSDFTRWESESPGGCPVVFGTDEQDPDELDVYTNAWTPYPSIEDPSVHLYFPSFYHHFGSDAPWAFFNDGLLDVRLVTSQDGVNLTYVPGRRGRSPFVPLGVNRCGPTASSPSVSEGWCSPATGIEASTDPDTSEIYMADGYVPSADGEKVYVYAANLPVTHGGILAKKLWGTNTGVRVLSLRKDGFVSVTAPYVFAGVTGPTDLPSLTTVPLTVPKSCPPGPINVSTSCAYEYSDGKCPASAPPAACATDDDCHRAVPSKPNITCHGKPATNCVTGACTSGEPGGGLCVRRAPSSGVALGLNVETSVAGYVLVEVQRDGAPVAGMTLEDAVPIRGSALQAQPMWRTGASLESLAGTEVTLRIALTDARLFAVRVGCTSAKAAAPKRG